MGEVASLSIGVIDHKRQVYLTVMSVSRQDEIAHFNRQDVSDVTAMDDGDRIVFALDIGECSGEIDVLRNVVYADEIDVFILTVMQPDRIRVQHLEVGIIENLGYQGLALFGDQVKVTEYGELAESGVYGTEQVGQGINIAADRYKILVEHVAAEYYDVSVESGDLLFEPFQTLSLEKGTVFQIRDEYDSFSLEAFRYFGVLNIKIGYLEVSQIDPAGINVTEKGTQ